MIYPLLLVLCLVAGFGIHTTARYGDAERPVGVSAARWWWNTATETAVLWGCFVRSLPARFREWRQKDAPPPQPPVTPAAAPVPAKPVLPPVPPVAANGGAPVLSGAPIPPDHAAVHARIATQEFGDDAELLEFYAREAAAFGGYAEVWGTHADALLHGVGLDPAFTQVAAELADEVSEIAHAFAVIMHRFTVVYGDVEQWVANGGVLPFDARRFLTGGEGA